MTTVKITRNFQSLKIKINSRDNTLSNLKGGTIPV